MNNSISCNYNIQSTILFKSIINIVTHNQCIAFFIRSIRQNYSVFGINNMYQICILKLKLDLLVVGETKYIIKKS